jgi:hypothetical protein
VASGKLLQKDACKKESTYIPPADQFLFFTKRNLVFLSSYKSLFLLNKFWTHIQKIFQFKMLVLYFVKKASFFRMILKFRSNILPPSSESIMRCNFLCGVVLIQFYCYELPLLLLRTIYSLYTTGTYFLGFDCPNN